MYLIEVALSEWLLTNSRDREALSTCAVSSDHAEDSPLLLQRIRRHIDSVLNDSQLAPDSVAARVGISTRKLQELFGGSGETFTQYLKRRRLECCRDDLANPLLLHLSISNICSRRGFTDAAHFSRAFRERYERSPRAYRHETGTALAKRVWMRASRAAQDNLDFDPCSPELLETADAWIVSVEVQTVELLGSATTVLYRRMTQVLVRHRGAGQDEARAAAEGGMKIVMAPGKRNWQVRGILNKGATDRMVSRSYAPSGEKVKL